MVFPFLQAFGRVDEVGKGIPFSHHLPGIVPVSSNRNWFQIFEVEFRVYIERIGVHRKSVDGGFRLFLNFNP